MTSHTTSDSFYTITNHHFNTVCWQLSLNDTTTYRTQVSYKEVICRIKLIRIQGKLNKYTVQLYYSDHVYFPAYISPDLWQQTCGKGRRMWLWKTRGRLSPLMWLLFSVKFGNVFSWAQCDRVVTANEICIHLQSYSKLQISCMKLTSIDSTCYILHQIRCLSTC